MAQNTIHQPHKSSLGGLDANLLAALCYGSAFIFSFIPIVRYVAWLAPLVVFFLEKASRHVKFHALQALVLNVIGALLSAVVSIVGSIIKAVIVPSSVSYSIWDAGYYDYWEKVKLAATIGTVFTVIVYVLALGIGVLQILAAIKAWKYEEYGLPVIGNIAGKLAEKLGKVNVGGTGTTPPPAQPYTYTPPAQPYTPPTQPYAPQAQPYTPPTQPASPAETPRFDPQTGQPIAPPPAEAPRFDPQTGQPIAPPPADAPRFDPQTGQPLNPGDGQ